jgi:hypothetical protein
MFLTYITQNIVLGLLELDPRYIIREALYLARYLLFI